MLALYCFALFIGAILLFSLEPMVGKMLLPQCGGAASVWNTCMVFFQAVLLLGYAYAHFSTSFLGVRRQAAIHLVVILLPLLVLPVVFSAQTGPLPGQDPNLWLLVQLTLVVGLPFFVVSSTAPLLQRWFASLGLAASSDPYFLYSISNAGSLLALISYPFLIEPWLGLLMQTYFWTAGYLLLIISIFCCAVVMWIASRPVDSASLAARPAGPPTAKQRQKDRGAISAPPHPYLQRLGWIFTAFVPSSLMLGVTAHITTDIAPVPLLWIIPLALYLLSFVIVFARKPFISHSLMIAVMPYAVLLMPLYAFQLPMKFWMSIPVHLLTFFIVAMVCHGELVRSRPAANRLTEFYLWMSLGGVLGGMFNALVAPQIFNSVIEYPLMLVIACFIRPASKDFSGRTEFNLLDFAWLMGLIAVGLMMVGLAYVFLTANSFLVCILVYGVPAVICFAFKKRPIRFALGLAVVFLTVDYYVSPQSGNIILRQRDFYGVKRVSITQERFHSLVNGNIVHGLQEMYPAISREPLGYYSRMGPLGDLFCAFDDTKKSRRVAVIGLGTGAMASYVLPGQHVTFYEIDPAVIRIATDPQLFTYLKQCPGKWDVIEGDARLQLAKARDDQFDTIILDAFSSDSIPLHLLTQEALHLYCQKLKPDGVLVFHISNRYLNLEQMLAALAEKNNLVCLENDDVRNSEEDKRNGKYPSHYLVMARRLSDLGNLSENPAWSRPSHPLGFHVWSDDYSNILSVLAW
jgi:SAM-dependent methyltransferase